VTRKSFLSRIDGKNSVNGSTSKGPSGAQVYSDLNRWLETIFRMIAGRFGMTKYMSKSKGHKRKKSKGSFVGRAFK
jgi:hypothetical protein